MSNGNEPQNTGGSEEVQPQQQAEMGMTGGQPDATSPSPSDQPAQDATPFSKEHMDAAHAIGQQQGAKVGFEQGKKEGFASHPWQSLFDILAGGGEKIGGYRTSDDPDVKSGAQKVGSPIMVKRGNSEKWGAILAGALAGAAAGYGPGGAGKAITAGMQTGEGIRAKDESQASEQYQRQTTAKREDIQNSLHLAEIHQRHLLNTDLEFKHAENLTKQDAALKSTLDLHRVTPEFTINEDKFMDEARKNPELVHKYLTVAIGVDNSDPSYPKTKYGFYRTDMMGDISVTKEMKDRWVVAGIPGADRITATGETDPETGQKVEKGQPIDVKTLLNWETQRHAKDNERMLEVERQKHEAELNKKESDKTQTIILQGGDGKPHQYLINTQTGEKIKDLGQADKVANPVAEDLAAQRKMKQVRAMDKDGKVHLTDMATAQQKGYTGITLASASEYEKAQTHNVTLNEMQVKLNDVTNASAALNQNISQRTIIAKALTTADKAGNTVEQMARAISEIGALKGATPQTQEYVQAVLSLRESSLGLPKEITGGSRVSEVQASALWATIPGAGSLNSNYALGQARKFQAILNRLRKRIPEIEGTTAEEIHEQLRTEEKATTQTTRAPVRIQAPAGASQEVVVKGQVVGHVVNKKFVPLKRR